MYKFIILTCLILVSVYKNSVLAKVDETVVEKRFSPSCFEISRNGNTHFLHFYKGIFLTSYQIITNFQDLIKKIDPDFELQFLKMHKLEGEDEVAVYIQTYKSIPIEGTYLKLITIDSNLVAANCFLILNKKNNVLNKIHENIAIGYALKRINAVKYKWENKSEEDFLKKIKNNDAATYYPVPVLCFYDSSNSDSFADYCLTYKIKIATDIPRGLFKVFINANNGKILKLSNIQKHANCDNNWVSNTCYVETFHNLSQYVKTEQQKCTTDAGDYFFQFRLQEHDGTRGKGIETYDMQQGYDRHDYILEQSSSDCYSWNTVKNVKDLNLATYRNLKDPGLSYPVSTAGPKYYLGINWNNSKIGSLQAHINCGVGNFFFYLLVNGGQGKNEHFQNICVNGLGMDKAISIVYNSLPLLNYSKDYSNLEFAMNNYVKTKYGFDSNEAIQVANAWYAVGVRTIPFWGTRILDVNNSVSSGIVQYTNQGFILAHDGFSIEQGASCELISESGIYLRSGFHAKRGSIFKAYIGDLPCSAPPLRKAKPKQQNPTTTGNTELENNSSTKSVLENKNLAKNAVTQNFCTLNPNPFSSKAIIEYNLSAKSNVSIIRVC